MSRCHLGMFVGAALVLAAAAETDEPGFTSLFDGKTLNGWSVEHSDRISVRDGVVIQDGGTGWLRSATSYKDFEFRAEYRVVKKGGDSGIFFRASAASSAKEPFWPEKGFQLQVIDNPDGQFRVFGHGTPPPTYDRQGDLLKQTLKGPGEWQSIALKVVGKHAEASLNGVRITVSDAIILPEGHIGLQGENGQFEWRNLRIKPL